MTKNKITIKSKIPQQNWCRIWDDLDLMDKNELIDWIICDMSDEKAEDYLKQLDEEEEAAA